MYGKFDENGNIIYGPQPTPVGDGWSEVILLDEIPKGYDFTWVEDGGKYKQELVEKDFGKNLTVYLSRIDRISEETRASLCPFSLQSSEYKLVEEELRQYDETGEVGDTIQSHCDAFEKNLQEGVSDLKQKESEYKNTLRSVRRKRLEYKQKMRNSSSLQELETHLDDFMQSIENG